MTDRETLGHRAERAERAVIAMPRFNAALILAITLQCGGFVWWAARQQTQQEHTISAVQQFGISLTALNEKVDALRFAVPTARDIDRLQTQIGDIELRLRAVERGGKG